MSFQQQEQQSAPPASPPTVGQPQSGPAFPPQESRRKRPLPPPSPQPPGTPPAADDSVYTIQVSDLDHGEDAARDNLRSIEKQQQQQQQQQKQEQDDHLTTSPKRTAAAPPSTRTIPVRNHGNSNSSNSGDQTAHNTKFQHLIRRVMKTHQQKPGSSISAMQAVISEHRERRSSHHTRDSSHPVAFEMLDYMNEINHHTTDDATVDRSTRGSGGDAAAAGGGGRTVGEDVIVDMAMPLTTPGNADRLFLSAHLTPAHQQEQHHQHHGGGGGEEYYRDAGNMDCEPEVFHPAEEHLPLFHGDHHHHHRASSQEQRTARGKSFGANARAAASGTTSEYASLAAGVLKGRAVRKHRQPKLIRYFFRFCRYYVCNPHYLLHIFHQNVMHSLVMYIALPCFALAWVLFYYVGNPTFDFLPDYAQRVSWWLNFLGRHILLMELSRFSQWIVLDVVILRTQISVKFFGPLVTLTAIQAKGWPFVMTTWGALAILLLQGDNLFQMHWFHFTGWLIYTTKTGVEIISSNHYLRILVAMVLAGLITTIKRTAFAVHFGQRQLALFKPRLEKLLGDMVLLTEVATLGEEAKFVVAQDGKIPEEDSDSAAVNGRNNKNMQVEEFKPSVNKLWSEMGVQFSATVDGNYDLGQLDDDRLYGGNHCLSPTDGEGVGAAATSVDLLSQCSSEGDISRTPSGNIQIKSRLDRWDEPKTRSAKSAQSATIEDVLRFRRALACMDEPYLFGEAFGPADSRDSCILSASTLYNHLMKLNPTAPNLSFEVLSLAIAVDDVTEEYETKKIALRRLFRPDAKGVLTLLAFVQSVDIVYRRLRYFIASVRNSSVIDKALEDTLNWFFYALLALLLMPVMKFNPWPIVVSITSLLVSISFALGPSVSKFVEGVLLIVARRPYDLGDRIYITDSNSVVNPGVAESWFVEDINLWSTTLRYSRSNEVSTINNSAIAASRIVNGNRSPNAIVEFDFTTHVSILKGTKLSDFRAALDRYVKENPRTWEAVAFVRQDTYTAELKRIIMRLAFRHRNSWQDAARILINRGQLLRYVYETAEKLNINYEMEPALRLVYQGGQFVSPYDDASKQQDDVLSGTDNVGGLVKT